METSYFSYAFFLQISILIRCISHFSINFRIKVPQFKFALLSLSDEWQTSAGSVFPKLCCLHSLYHLKEMITEYKLSKTPPRAPSRHSWMEVFGLLSIWSTLGFKCSEVSKYQWAVCSLHPKKTSLITYKRTTSAFKGQRKPHMWSHTFHYIHYASLKVDEFLFSLSAHENP